MVVSHKVRKVTLKWKKPYRAADGIQTYTVSCRPSLLYSEFNDGASREREYHSNKNQVQNVHMTASQAFQLKFVPCPLFSFTTQLKWAGSKTYNKSFSDNGERVFQDNTLVREITGLTPSTSYVFRVSARTACGEGADSNAITATTLEDGEGLFR